MLVAVVERLVSEYEVGTIIVGLPLSLSGKPSSRSRQVMELANRLRNKLKLPVELVDERYTTTAAADILSMARGRETAGTRPRSVGRSRKDKLAANRIAATLILEKYLANHTPTGGINSGGRSLDRDLPDSSAKPESDAGAQPGRQEGMTGSTGQW